MEKMENKERFPLSHGTATTIYMILFTKFVALGLCMCLPLTAILFSIELTLALSALLPLMLACTASNLVTSLVMPRSILTEKLSRRGYHPSREYGVDSLEMVSVTEVMTELSVSAIEAGDTSDPPEGLPEVRLTPTRPAGRSPRRWQLPG